MTDGYLNFDTKINTSGFTSGLKKLAGALAIGATVKAAVKAGMSFESAFAGVRKTVDATAEQLAGLKQGIRDMAKELPTSANEIAGVAEAAGQLGIETDNILGFTKTMTMLGDATNLTAEQAATTLARFANITGMSQDNFDRLGSSVVALGNNFATTEAEIADMAQNIASAGSQVGMSEPEIMGFAAALSSVGMEAAAGGTAISKLVKDMQLAVETGSEDLQQFANVAGVSANEFSKAFRDNAANAVTKFFTGLNDTERLGKSAIAVLDDMGISEVRLSDAILRAAGSGDLFQKALETSKKAWEDNTALTKEAEQRYETLESQLGILKNHLIDLGISFYDGIQEPLKKAVSSAIDSLSSLTKSIQNGSLQDAVAGIGEAFGSIVTTTGNIASTVLPPLISALGAIGKQCDVLIPSVLGVVTAFKGFNTAESILKSFPNLISSLSSPVGIFTLSVAGLTAAFIGLKKIMQNTNSDSRAFEEQCKKTGKAIKEQKKSYDEYKQTQAKSLTYNIAEVESSKKLAEELFRLVDANGKVAESDSGRAEFILTKLNDAYGMNYSLVDGAITKNGEEKISVDELKDSILNLVEAKRFDVLNESSSEIYKTAKEEEIKAIQNELEAYNELQEGIKQYGDASGAYWKAYVSGLQENYDKAREIRKEYTDDINNYEEGYALAQEGRFEEAQERLLQMNDNYVSAESAVQQYGKGSQEALNAYATDAEKSLLNVKNALENYIKSGSESAKKNLISSLDDAEARLEEFASAGGDYTKEFSDSISGTKIDLSGLLNDISAQLQQGGGEIASYAPEIFSKNFLENVEPMESAANEASNSSVDEAERTIESGAPSVGQAMGSGVAAGILASIPLVTSASSRMGQLALASARKSIDSHSPSKKFKEMVGKTIPQGVAVGIKENTYEVTDAVKQMFDDIKLQKELGSISEGEYYEKLREYRDQYLEESTKEWWDYTKELISYEEKLRDRQFKNLDWFHDNSIISDSLYYQMLADLRDQYFSESDEEWQDYTEKILNHQMDLINDTKDSLKDALEEAQNAFDDAVADGAEKMREFSPSLLKIKSDDGNGNITEYYRPNDYSYRKYSDEYYNSMMNMQGLIGMLEPGTEEYEAGLKIYAGLAAEDPQEAVKQIQTYLNMGLDDFINHIKQTTKIWREDDSRGADIYGFIPGLELEKAEDDMEQFEKKWFDAFGTLPDQSYNIGVDMMQSIINGALSQIENFKSQVVDGMLSVFSGASIGINASAASPAAASAGGGNTYIINSPGSTIGESIRALKNQDTINRLRGY